MHTHSDICTETDTLIYIHTELNTHIDTYKHTSVHINFINTVIEAHVHTDIYIHRDTRGHIHTDAYTLRQKCTHNN